MSEKDTVVCWEWGGASYTQVKRPRNRPKPQRPNCQMEIVRALLGCRVVSSKLKKKYNVKVALLFSAIEKFLTK